MECKSLTATVLDAFAICIFGVCALLRARLKKAMITAKTRNQIMQTFFQTDVERVQERVMRRSGFFLWFLIVVNLYCFINSLAIYIFYSDDCVPYHLPLELDSFFQLLDTLVTYQIWMVPVVLHFWPTKLHIR